MVAHVLVPIDGSEQSEKALDHALDIFPGATVTVLNVITGVPPEPHMDRMDGDYDALRERRRTMLQEMIDERDPETDVTIAIETGWPSREITGYAMENDVDHLVIGSHGRDGVTRVLLGSVAEKVSRRAPCPVTIVR